MRRIKNSILALATTSSVLLPAVAGATVCPDAIVGAQLWFDGSCRDAAWFEQHLGTPGSLILRIDGPREPSPAAAVTILELHPDGMEARTVIDGPPAAGAPTCGGYAVQAMVRHTVDWNPFGQRTHFTERALVTNDAWLSQLTSVSWVDTEYAEVCTDGACQLEFAPYPGTPEAIADAIAEDVHASGADQCVDAIDGESSNGLLGSYRYHDAAEVCVHPEDSAVTTVDLLSDIIDRAEEGEQECTPSTEEIQILNPTGVRECVSTHDGSSQCHCEFDVTTHYKTVHADCEITESTKYSTMWELC